MKPLKLIFKILFILASGVYLVTLAKLLFLRSGWMRQSGFRYNLIPFSTISHYIRRYDHYNFNTWFSNLFGNILLFVPMGVIIAVLLGRHHRMRRLSLILFGTILAIESVQLFFRLGIFDVDDIILNFIGGWFGGLLVHVSAAAVNRFRMNRKEESIRRSY